MGQEERVDLARSVGYALKEASAALRREMEAALRPLDMTITHYSCLELLAQRPGLSHSDLARGTFVTRQSMNVLLRALESAGEVQIARRPTVGKALPTELTDTGRERLAAASAAVRAVEARMLGDISPDKQDELFAMLRAMVVALRHPA